MTREPVDKLSEVLHNLHELNAETSSAAVRRSMDEQIKILTSVQDQMQTQLRLHDAQIAALREVIAMMGAAGR